MSCVNNNINTYLKDATIKSLNYMNYHYSNVNTNPIYTYYQATQDINNPFNSDFKNHYSNTIQTDLNIDLTSYDETFYEAIDNLFLLHFGKEASELIYFYLYERIDPDGTVNELEDVNGNPLILNSPMDLWNVIHMLKHIK